MIEPLEERTLLSIDVTGIPNWTEQGPGPIFGGSVQGITDRPVTGAIQAVVVHPDDANIIWIGAVNGGIWKTIDGGTTWQPKTDQFPTVAISALALDPTNPNTLWAGTGRTSSRRLGPEGNGLLKSTDGGETWSIMPAGLSLGALGVHALLPTKLAQGSGHIVFVGSDRILNEGGLLRSADGGSSGDFRRISGIADDTIDNDGDGLIDADDLSEQNGLPAGTVDSIASDPTGAHIYVGMRVAGHGHGQVRGHPGG